MRRYGGLIALALSLAVTQVGAQSQADLDRARGLFKEGVALSAEGDWAGALAKFQAVSQVKMTMQVAFNIAECEEHLGQLVAALGHYRLAEEGAMSAGKQSVLEQVRARIADLESRISKPAAEATGEAPAPLPAPSPAAAPAPEAAPRAAPAPRAEEPAPVSNTSAPTLGIAALSLGGVGLVASGVFFGLRQSALSKVDDACGDDEHCPPSAESDYDTAATFNAVALASLGVGVLASAAGVYWTWLSPGSEKVEIAATATGTGAGGISVRGAF